MSMSGFAKFGLREEIMAGIKDQYFHEPTPIQERAIPVALAGKDLIGQAQTGTGKTAAFVLPMLQIIKENSQSIQGLIMTPTRELAIQIGEDVADLAKHLQINVLTLHGGRDIQAQMNKLQGRVHIVVGTPGRILDHLRRGTLHFGRLKMLVLDEADKMLEMGFQEDVETIIAQSANKRQTLLFSATMPDRVKELGHRFMIQPTHIKVEMKQATAEKTKQYFYVVNQSEKIEALKILAQELKPFLSIIFVNTQDRVEFVTEQLQQDGYEARALHGGLSQNKREQLMEAFRQMKFQYLVCTDIASRGVDVEGVTHVFNFDLPSDTESYIHRVGRTGRAGQEGTAITFVSPRQKAIMAKIESAIKQKIDERILTGVKGFAEIPKHKNRQPVLRSRCRRCLHQPGRRARDQRAAGPLLHGHRHPEPGFRGGTAMSGPPAAFYYDFSSPYSYLAAERISGLFAEAQVEQPEWQPISFGHVLKTTGRRPWSFEEDRSADFAEIQRRADDRGLPKVLYPEGWPIENYSLNPVRAAVYAKESGRVVSFSLACFRQIFAGGRDMSDVDNVLVAAAACELHPKAVLKGIETQSVKDKLRAATDEAIERGVEGIPTIAVGDRLFWGDDELERAVRASQRE